MKKAPCVTTDQSTHAKSLPNQSRSGCQYHTTPLLTFQGGHMKELTTYNRAAGYLNRIFDLLNQEFFENTLSRPTITIQSTPKAYGHFSLRDDTWISKGGAFHEINIGAGTLVRRSPLPWARTAIDGVSAVRELYNRGVRVHVLNMGLIENTLTGNLICFPLQNTNGA